MRKNCELNRFGIGMELNDWLWSGFRFRMRGGLEELDLKLICWGGGEVNLEFCGFSLVSMNFSFKLFVMNDLGL